MKKDTLLFTLAALLLLGFAFGFMTGSVVAKHDFRLANAKEAGSASLALSLEIKRNGKEIKDIWKCLDANGLRIAE